MVTGECEYCDQCLPASGVTWTGSTAARSCICSVPTIVCQSNEMIVFLRNIKTYCKECSKLPRVLLEFFVVLIHPAGVLRHLLALSVHLRLASLQLSEETRRISKTLYQWVKQSFSHLLTSSSWVLYFFIPARILRILFLRTMLLCGAGSAPQFPDSS